MSGELIKKRALYRTNNTIHEVRVTSNNKDIQEIVKVLNELVRASNKTGVLGIENPSDSIGTIKTVKDGNYYKLISKHEDGDYEILLNRKGSPLRILNYIVLLSQSGTDAPTAQVLQNTLDNETGCLEWSRISAGHYRLRYLINGTIINVFAQNKTKYFIQNISSDFVYATWVEDAGKYYIDVFSNGSDGVLNNHPFEITVYQF